MSNLWTVKGGTLSDKSARNEYGLTQDEIYRGIREGKLQFRENHIHGNPFLRLLRGEVEEWVKELRGEYFLKIQQLETRLKKTKTKINKLTRELKQLSKEKEEIENQLADSKDS